MQVNESVNAANLLLVGSQTGQFVPMPQTDATSSDFASFLTNANEKADTGVKEPKVDTVQSENKSENKPEDTYKAESKNEPKDVPVEKKDVTSKSEDMSTDTAEEVMPKDIMDMTDEEIQELLTVVGQLLQSVMTQFQLSGVELYQQLESFGMTVEDLFTKDGLKEFFLEMNSAEVSDLIVDESLNQELNSFLEEFEEVLEPLENLELDLESLVTDETVDMALSEFPEVAELVQQMETKPQEESQTKVFQPTLIPREEQPDIQPEFVDVEEPEVIVTETEIQTTDNQEQQSNQQTETFKENLPDKTEKPDQEWERPEPQKTFTNPILQAIENAVDNVQEIGELDNQPVRGADVIEQIVEQVRIQMNQDTTSLEMQLYPEHLGKIQIHIISKDGVMTARIVAETEAAKQAIENGLTNLKESMQDQNLKVDAIEVMVSTTGFERGNEGQGSETNNQTAKGRRKLDLSDSEQDVTDEEAAEEERMRASGSSVSYTA